MSLKLRLLGRPGRDNALFVSVDTGRRIVRLLFDCGQCLAGLPRSDLARLDHLFFSHLHMDHVCGFDGLFRLAYNRADKPMTIWGPPGTIEIMRHRFQGFVWNLHEGEPGKWVVHDVHAERIENAFFLTSEAFAIRHHQPPTRRRGTLVLADDDFAVHATALDHGIPSMGYLIRESDRHNVRLDALSSFGAQPGPWLQALKDVQKPDNEPLTVAGKTRALGEWRAEFLRRNSGESAAYLTDFRLNEGTTKQLAAMLAGCETLVSESHFCRADEDLAQQTGHLSARQAAELARAAGVERLLLFHVSERYSPLERAEMLAEARAIFPASSWPAAWQ